MNTKNEYKKLARLTICQGVNLQKGQRLVIQADIEAADFVRMLVDEAYAAGCKEAVVKWSDTYVSRQTLKHADEEIFDEVSDWLAHFYNDYAKEGAAFIRVESEDPEAMEGLSSRRQARQAKAKQRALKPYRQLLDGMEAPWCIVPYPGKNWARKVHPDNPQKLDRDILDVCRITDDPESNWNAHIANLEGICEKLNGLDIDHLHYTNGLGTDLKVYMTDHPIFCGGCSYLNNGIRYLPNIPTEEVFVSPDCTKTEGIVYASMPLMHQGGRIEDFWIRFEKGRAVQWDAKVGKERLDDLILTDAGSGRLGEAALVDIGTPISQKNTLFFNTLLDENARCHLALGNAYPETVQGGLQADDEQLKAMGLNDSAVHVDFMIGTEDLHIDAVCRNGQTVPVFENGGFTSSFLKAGNQV